MTNDQLKKAPTEWLKFENSVLGIEIDHASRRTGLGFAC